MIWYRSSVYGKGRHWAWFKSAYMVGQFWPCIFTCTVPEPEALQGLCGDVQGSSGVPQETQAGEWKLHTVHWGTSKIKHEYYNMYTVQARRWYAGIRGNFILLYGYFKLSNERYWSNNIKHSIYKVRFCPAIILPGAILQCIVVLDLYNVHPMLKHMHKRLFNGNKWGCPLACFWSQIK